MRTAVFRINLPLLLTTRYTAADKHVALDFLGLVGDMGWRHILVPVWETEPFLPGVSETPGSSGV